MLSDLTVILYTTLAVALIILYILYKREKIRRDEFEFVLDLTETLLNEFKPSTKAERLALNIAEHIIWYIKHRIPDRLAMKEDIQRELAELAKISVETEQNRQT